MSSVNAITSSATGTILRQELIEAMGTSIQGLITAEAVLVGLSVSTFIRLLARCSLDVNQKLRWVEIADLGLDPDAGHG